MAIVTKIDKATCKQLEASVRAALLTVADLHGLELVVGGGGFDAGMYRPRVEFRTKAKASDEWNRFAAFFKLPADAIGKRITVRGIDYTIAELLPKSTRFPVLCQRTSDSRFFKLPADLVAKALAEEVANG